MKTTRRTLLKNAARLMAALAAGNADLSRTGLLRAQRRPDRGMAGMAHGQPTPAPAKPGHPWLQPDALARFVDPLPIPATLRATERREHPTNPKQQVGYLNIAMRPADVHVHRDLPTTPMWAYNGLVPGPTIEARTGAALWIDWVNQLPAEHFLPIDHTLCGAGADLPQVRTAVHVHGASVPAESDGFPEDWKTPRQTYRAVYPMQQEAATLWYHDHAMGLERLNQYAGLFGFLLIRDAHEESLRLPANEHEIPLVLCDRLFFADGQLHYPDSGDPSAPWIPEIYGDVVMANGKLFPYLDVEPRAYRFRVLNASNTRFFRFTLSNRMIWTQIGSDQGLLPEAVQRQELALACAERADMILDFSGMVGQRCTLVNQSQELMEFRVAPRTVAIGAAAAPDGPGATLSVPTILRTIQRIPESAAIRTRMLTLNEYMHPKTHVMLMLLNGKYWHDPITENPRLDSIEIWNLINTTQDLHPIHLHLVRFQLLDRRPFDVDDLLDYGKFHYIGDPAPPEPGEAGWKDTIQAHPETVTRIIVPFKGYPGRYVWHCHLLEHAANEMMRPFEVLPA
ncbi:MAG: multicopper oxidase domain-containing protein [Terracidiphilus sp.]